MAREFRHDPVLLDRSVELLNLSPSARVVDGTLGGGGHTAAVLEQLGPEGMLIGLDRDAEAIAATTRRLRESGLLDQRVHLVHESFRHLDLALGRLGIDRVDAVLLDLGVSSPQLDHARRGFRFGPARETEASVPLDMRMDAESGPTAAELLNRTDGPEIERWLREYGELPGSRRLARAIVQARESEPFETADQLLRVIDEAGIGRGRRHHPATLVFQALRIAVNDELGALEDGLEAAVRCLRTGGRLVVIAYHSLEDRTVKRTFRDLARGCVCPPGLPVCTCGRVPSLRVLTRRPIAPGEDEIARNPRARSARLRAAERIEEAA